MIHHSIKISYEVAVKQFYIWDLAHDEELCIKGLQH